MEGYSMIVVKLILLLTCFGLAKMEKPVRYDNHKLYKVNLSHGQHVQLLNAHEKPLKLNNWRNGRNPGDFAHIMLPPESQAGFEQLLNSHNFNYSLQIDDVQKLIDAQRPKQRVSGHEWTQYHTLEDIYAWLDGIEQKYAQVVTPFTIGNTYEGRPIRGIKISYRKGNRAVFIEANIHGNEWISSATITYFLNQLLTNQVRPDIRHIALNVDWYIIPVLNPDGFVYTHEHERVWRKSRFPSDPTGRCIGTDLNRNFDYRWMEAGTSSDPCSNNYPGPHAQSDPEVQHLTNFLKHNITEGSIRIYASIHAFGRMVLSPWGHTMTEFPEHYPQMMKVAKGFAKALYQRHHTEFLCGSSAATLYRVSGSSKDWAYGVMNITLPYTIELRDRGEYGFLLPPEQIIPTGEEVTDGFVGMIAAAHALGAL